jgi:hypothetical protein
MRGFQNPTNPSQNVTFNKAMNTRNILTILFIFLLQLAFAQADTINRKTALVAKKRLTYFWIGRGCPDFIDTKSKYGFNIKCKGCRKTLIIVAHNRRVIAKLNRVYGENWFEKNIENFY